MNRNISSVKYLLGLVLTMTLLTGHAQQRKPVANAAYLKNLSKELDKTYQEYRQVAEQYAFERDIPIRRVLENGATVKLNRILPSGIPEYYMTYNQKAATNVGTTKLRPNAQLSLNMTGKSMLIGVWDAGSVNAEHQELVGRVEIKDNIPFDDHGTHVAGTILATGINPQAKGMSYQAEMFSYDFSNDNAEMAIEAAEGLIISNHSYGLRTGWDVATGGTGWQWFGDPSVSNVEDYKFGYYDAANSRVWDDIAFNAPYYTIVKSSGNDRTDTGDGTRPPDGPYDCISSKSVAKNIITVGAVAHLNGDYTKPDDVVMSDFSSWGPTDDGRIKPDIVAIGVDVFSTLSESVDAYGLQSGTSMSAPNATGSIALLQEYHSQIYAGRYMKSATLKGLVIHTANETGINPGPDYEYGWGLLAVDKATNVMTRNDGENFIIKELTLDEGDSIVYKVKSNGTQPLVATICWTDVPGTPVPISLDPTNLMLVNDLDMRIYDENNTPYLPWILDPSRPDRGATFGDNFRDNVEKVEISTPAAGEYTVVIKHKNTLRNGAQDFSLIISNASPNLNFTRFYWIGGSGNWNDPTKWSRSSGGNVANAVPSINNPVIFDNNSFPSPSNTITLTGNANCYNINYYTTNSCQIKLASFTLNIDGSIHDENNKISFDNGKLSFRGIVSKNNEIRAAASAFQNVNLDFNSSNGSWSFINDFETKSLIVANSSIHAPNRQIESPEISITSSAVQVIDFSGSKIQGINSMDLSSANNVNLDGSLISFSNASGNTPKSMKGNNTGFYNIEVNSTNLNIEGNNDFNKIIVNGNLTLSGNNNIDSLRLSDVSSLTLTENSNQTINRYFQATGSVNNLIGISSSGAGNAGLFADDSNIRFCFDFLDINNVSVSGRTSFLTGDNSTLDANSTGWIELDCEDALFPSFDVMYPCALGETRFIDTSTGSPTAWNWSFGNLQYPSENTSTIQNPFHNYRFEGDYDVEFNVENGQFNETITRTITIIDYESGLGVPSVNIDGTRLTSSVIAPKYQWYLNGLPIPGADDRIYDVANSGVYFVTVEDDKCLFKSEATVVTSLEEELLNKAFTLYPNPSAGLFTMELDSEYQGVVQLELINLIGKEIKKFQYNKESPHFKQQLSLEGLSNGVYQLVVNVGETQTVKKIVISK